MGTSSWINKHSEGVRTVSLAVAFLGLGFTIGMQVGRSSGESAVATSRSTTGKAQAMTERALKFAEDCSAKLQRTLAHQRPAGAPESQSKHN